MKLFSIATALLALTALVSAQEVDKRLIDISDTQLEVKEVYNNDNSIDTFVVTVQRTDDLLADDGTFLAERIMSVAFNFDVKDHEVLLNKVALPLEVQEKPEEPITVTVTVEAALIVGPALDPETNIDDLMNAFDKGLVTVQVTASTEFLTADDGSIVRRLTLRETIVEVNGHEITQTDAVQQMLEIMPDGTLGSYTPLTFGNIAGSSDMGSDEGLGCQVKKFFDNGFGALFTVIGLAAIITFGIALHARRARRSDQYAKIQQEEAAAAEDFVQVAVIDDKKYDDEKKASN
ncbi:hypothetical protein BG011_009787 [Mortierella polycephala]|uniref:Mid2 domain-containing protein n=1 Tax=Mortierella polycephala TaxID=41804 RepID=A0A9P6QA43_9FUNG|nr:hypothetical protein BG011_009787 [Mortierella polycephala]